MLTQILDILKEKEGALYELKKNTDDKQEALDIKYLKKEQISSDTFIFTYELPQGMKLGLNLGQHIAIE